jgi:hypothetical protein
LKVQAQIDSNTYPMGRKVTHREMTLLNLYCDGFHCEWNYTLHSRE